MAAASDDESSASEIPPKNPKQEVEAKSQDNAEENTDMDEDEYVVESITAHKFSKKGSLVFRVKWQGYPDSEATWEPEENLDGAPDELEAYYEEIGGRPQLNKSTSKPEPAAKKQKLSHNGAARTDTPASRAKKDRSVSERGSSTPGGYPTGSWEDHILNIETMTRDGDNIWVWVVWKKTGVKSKHPTQVVYAKAPQKCLQFYESHLQFNTAPSPKRALEETLVERTTTTEKEDSPIAKKLKPESEYSQEDDEDLGVKKVASAI